MIKYQHQRRNGFSLVELLIAVFIIALISGLVAFSSWRGQGRYFATSAAQKLAADLRLTQNRALSGKMQGAVAPSGYGIYTVSAGQYYIFYNTSASDVEYKSNKSIILETVNISGASLSPIGKSVFFTPPNPTTYINGSNSGSQIFTLLGSGNASLNVVIYSSGMIDTQ